MTRKKMQRTGSYRARDVKDNSLHTINIDTQLIEVTSFSDTTEKWIPGLQTHSMASNGNHVNVDGTDLVEVATGRKLIRLP